MIDSIKSETKFKMGNFGVHLKDNENVETLIKRFLRKTKKEKIVEETLHKSRYQKPSEKEKAREHKRKLLVKKLNRERQQEEMLADEKIITRGLK